MPEGGMPQEHTSHVVRMHVLPAPFGHGFEHVQVPERARYEGLWVLYLQTGFSRPNVFTGLSAYSAALIPL